MIMPTARLQMQHTMKFFALAALSVHVASCASDVKSCCSSLARQCPGQVVFRSDLSYDQVSIRWTENAQLTPACVFLPQNAQDISSAVQVLTARGERCQFAIKSGGHTPWPGANSIEDGIAFDLRYINQTTIATDRSFVRIGSGDTWGEVYDRLNNTGLAVPGGRCASTGVGGLTLGGGYSWLTPKVGWVADNIINYEIVLASGEITNANKTHNPDLFIALKGGGNNFGIVTNFDVAAFEHDQKIRGGFNAHPINTSVAILDGFDRFMSFHGNDPHAALALEFVLQHNSSQSQVLSWITMTDLTDEHPSLSPFQNIAPTLASAFGPTTFADYPGSVPPVSRVLFATATFQYKKHVLKGVHKISEKIFTSLRHIPDLTWDIQYEPLPKAYRDRGGGKNIMGLDDDTDLAIVFLMPLWKDPAFDEEVNRAVEKWYRTVKRYTTSAKAGCQFEYLNYAALFQDPLGSYGVEKFEFMRRVAKKYDPEGVFQELVPGGFKLDKKTTYTG